MAEEVANKVANNNKDEGKGGELYTSTVEFSELLKARYVLSWVEATRAYELVL